MRYKFKKLPEVKSFINRPVVGISYLGSTEICFGQDGPVTVRQMHTENPELFDVVDIIEIKTQIMVNLSAQYEYLHKYYGLNESAMAEKINEIAEKICSKI